MRRVVEDVLVGSGYFEAYTPSFAADGEVRLPEPLSSEAAALRAGLVDGLVGAARANVAVGTSDVALFEIARVYRAGGELPNERWHVGGIVQGGFAVAKGAVEGLYEALATGVSFKPADDLPRGARGARTPEGWVLALREPDLPGEWGAFELDVDALAARTPDLVLYEDVITYPPVRQDLAFVVDEEVPAGELVSAAAEAAGDALREMRAFDVYRGDQIDPGKKSIAFAVSFQSREKTLTDEEAGELRNRIVTALARRFGAQLRA
jgi:phenylalanyl-tRNA synthetase beta chain